MATAEIEQLQRELTALRAAFATALVWIGQSANTPLAHFEIQELLRIANRETL